VIGYKIKGGGKDRKGKYMKKMFLWGMAALALVFGLSVTSCATMGGDKAQGKVLVQAKKTGVPFEIVDSKGRHVVNAETPYTANLKTSKFVFLPQHYSIKYKNSKGEDVVQPMPYANPRVGRMIQDSLWFVVALVPGFVAWGIDAGGSKLYEMPTDQIDLENY
jgi:hypothetical protein